MNGKGDHSNTRLTEDQKQILWQAAEILGLLRKGLKVSVPISTNYGNVLLSLENQTRLLGEYDER